MAAWSRNETGQVYIQMTDAEKLLAIANFLFMEGIRVEDDFKVHLSYRTGQWRNVDQLDMLELIQYLDRWEYFNEIEAMIGNILYDRHKRRPPWVPLDKKTR